MKKRFAWSFCRTSAFYKNAEGGGKFHGYHQTLRRSPGSGRNFRVTGPFPFLFWPWWIEISWPYYC
jgi:hypothetical protein